MTVKNNAVKERGGLPPLFTLLPRSGLLENLRYCLQDQPIQVESRYTKTHHHYPSEPQECQHYRHRKLQKRLV
jgi:hypothetical protein